MSTKRFINIRRELEKKYTNTLIHKGVPLPKSEGGKFITMSPTALWCHTDVNPSRGDARRYREATRVIKESITSRTPIEEEVWKILKVYGCCWGTSNYFHNIKNWLFTEPISEVFERIPPQKTLNRLKNLFKQWEKLSPDFHWSITGAPARLNMKNVKRKKNMERILEKYSEDLALYFDTPMKERSALLKKGEIFGEDFFMVPQRNRYFSERDTDLLIDFLEERDIVSPEFVLYLLKRYGGNNWRVLETILKNHVVEHHELIRKFFDDVGWASRILTTTYSGGPMLLRLIPETVEWSMLKYVEGLTKDDIVAGVGVVMSNSFKGDREKTIRDLMSNDLDIETLRLLKDKNLLPLKSIRWDVYGFNCSTKKNEVEQNYSFCAEFEEFIDWSSVNPNYIPNEFILKHEDIKVEKLDRSLSIDIVRKYKDRLDWYDLIKKPMMGIRTIHTEEFIEEFRGYINMFNLRSEYLSLELTRRYIDECYIRNDIDWVEDIVQENDGYTLDICLEEFRSKIKWNTIAEDILTDELIIKYADELLEAGHKSPKLRLCVENVVLINKIKTHDRIKRMTKMSPHIDVETVNLFPEILSPTFLGEYDGEVSEELFDMLMEVGISEDILYTHFTDLKISINSIIKHRVLLKESGLSDKLIRYSGDLSLEMIVFLVKIGLMDVFKIVSNDYYWTSKTKNVLIDDGYWELRDAIAIHPKHALIMCKLDDRMLPTGSYDRLHECGGVPYPISKYGVGFYD